MRQPLYTIVLLFLLTSSITMMSAQNAPDFFVTDTDGNTHKLYEDYLDEGKVVVIKLFFVECPPCNSIAPLVENLYQSWDAGNGPVEFFEMTTSSSSTNNSAGVAAYQATHSISFPGIGNDGGSIIALNPYTNGTYGGYAGTPSFVVIASDGSVVYNPPSIGGGLGGTVVGLNAAIEDAIDNNGMDQTSVFECQIMNNTLIDTVFIQNGDGSNRSLVTVNASGDFTMSLPNTSYPGITDPHLSFVKNEEAFIGINIHDIIILRKQILLLDPFDNEWSPVIGDLNNDDKINVIDAVFLTKIALKLFTELPDGSPMFLYVNDACGVDDPTCSNGIPLSLNPGNSQSLEIQVLKKGDLSVLE